jgi:hypothetical protein
MTTRCDRCAHQRLDPTQKGRHQVIYARCVAPKGMEGKRAHLCSVQRDFYGLCSKGQLFEERVVETSTAPAPASFYGKDFHQSITATEVLARHADLTRRVKAAIQARQNELARQLIKVITDTEYIW